LSGFAGAVTKGGRDGERLFETASFVPGAPGSEVAIVERVEVRVEILFRGDLFSVRGRFESKFSSPEPLASRFVPF